MLFLPRLFALISCVILTFQDLKHRKIALLPVLTLWAGLFAIGLISLPKQVFLESIVLNLTIFTLIHFMLFIFLWFKHKRIFNPINKFHGSGDVLISLVLTCCFSPLNFLSFYVFSLVFTLITYSSYLLITGKQSIGFPTAGLTAVLLGILLIGQILGFDIHFYQDYFLQNL